ncbi:MAG: hypothetical protein ACI8ZB_005374 [Desulforhopalus sp.]|jgi:hypothetical protein
MTRSKTAVLVLAALTSNLANGAISRRYNIRASALICLITAKHEKSWGAISADCKIRIYLTGLTENGGLVYDIGTRESTSFDEFPNFDSISEIMFKSIRSYFSLIRPSVLALIFAPANL